MVQKRQFRKTHLDSHYCAALFRYMRDYALKFRELSCICLHRRQAPYQSWRARVPSIAAAERGRQVIVSSHDTFAVSDHDFCKFSLIPSVILLVDVPKTIQGSWYSGEVFIGIKDAVFEPSSPIRHATELYKCLESQMDGCPILFVYSDGGPDHRLTYVSVQLLLIALFFNLDLDLLVAGRTAPSHSWANPVERIMSIVNLGMQCIGIMREKMSEEFEKAVGSSNNLKDLRSRSVDFKSNISSYLKTPKDLIASLMVRLELKARSSRYLKLLLTVRLNSFSMSC